MKWLKRKVEEPKMVTVVVNTADTEVVLDRMEEMVVRAEAAADKLRQFELKSNLAFSRATDALKELNRAVDASRRRPTRSKPW